MSFHTAKGSKLTAVIEDPVSSHVTWLSCDDDRDTLIIARDLNRSSKDMHRQINCSRHEGEVRWDENFYPDPGNSHRRV
jgi:hypothetical protein